MTTIQFTIPNWFIVCVLIYMGVSTVLGITNAWLNRKIRKLTEERNRMMVDE